MFAETALMVRNPALEIINNLKSADYQKPAVRYLLCNKFCNFVATIFSEYNLFWQTDLY